MIRHITVNIDTILEMSDKKLERIFEMPASEVRSELQERKAAGELKIGSENCEGFSPITGCPGHENT